MAENRRILSTTAPLALSMRSHVVKRGARGGKAEGLSTSVYRYKAERWAPPWEPITRAIIAVATATIIIIGLTMAAVQPASAAGARTYRHAVLGRVCIPPPRTRCSAAVNLRTRPPAGIRVCRDRDGAPRNTTTYILAVRINACSLLRV